MREPDWEALAELQFLLYNRIADSLNAALSSIALSDMPEAQDKPPGYWKERATIKVANVLNLFTAWSYLIRYKQESSIPEQALRPFHVNSLLAWLGDQLQIEPVPQVEPNLPLHANQESIQEALLLLHSAACALGTGVRLETEVTRLGTWFHIRFNRPNPLPPTLDALLASFKDHWRDQSTLFELATARDFVRLNGSDLMLGVARTQGDLMFFVRAVGVEQPPASPSPPMIQQRLPGKTKPLDPSEAMTPLPRPFARVNLTPEDFGATPILSEEQVAGRPPARKTAPLSEQPDQAPPAPEVAEKPPPRQPDAAPRPLLRRVSPPNDKPDENPDTDAPSPSDSP